MSFETPEKIRRRVRRMLREGDLRRVTLYACSIDLGMGQTTLMRYLRESGTTFAALKDIERQRRLDGFREAAPQGKCIARDLGFGSATGFYRWHQARYGCGWHAVRMGRGARLLIASQEEQTNVT